MFLCSEPKTLEASEKKSDDSTEAPVSLAGATEAWQFCKERSKSIEVKYENMEHEQVLTKVHFQYDPGVSTDLNIIVLCSIADTTCMCSVHMDYLILSF